MSINSVGVVGCGGISEMRHIPAWKKIKRARLHSVCDMDLDKAKRIARLFHIPSYYPNHQEMLKKEKLDIVDICTPTTTHSRLSIYAMGYGKNVIVEKPMARTFFECQEMIKAAEKYDVKLTVCHTMRFYPVFAKIKEIADAATGDVLSLDISVPYREMQPWVSSQGGALWECLIHQVYITLYLMGYITNVKVNIYDDKEPQRNMEVVLRTERGIARLHQIKAQGSGRIDLYTSNEHVIYPLWAFNSAVIEVRKQDWTGVYLQESLNHIKLLTGQCKRCLSYLLLKDAVLPHFILFNKFIDALCGLDVVPVSPQEGSETVKVLENIESQIADFQAEKSSDRAL